ncbi:MAG: hypothetical protein OXU61_10560, partial [Gammaproteobacteria bacterium]|nr:hypothetical protein [Gammaproteobacteria bacterium]
MRTSRYTIEGRKLAPFADPSLLLQLFRQCGFLAARLSLEPLFLRRHRVPFDCVTAGKPPRSAFR